METITIPATLDEAVGRLNGIERLLTAKGWERAAIVAAFVRLHDGPGGDQRSTIRKSENGRLSATEFAALKVAGLTSSNTVQHYRACWQEAVDAGKTVDPEPGQVVELPDMPFPPSRSAKYYAGLTSSETARQLVKAHGVEVIVSAVAELPEVTKAVVEDAAAFGALREMSAVEVELAMLAPSTLDERWVTWLGRANTLFTTGARLAESSDRADVNLGGHAEAALHLYQHLTERRIDAEIRDLFDSEGIGR